MGVKRRGLGRGLDSLLSSNTDSKIAAEDNMVKKNIAEKSSSNGELQYVALTQIQVNPHQPRKIINEEALTELANSIRQQGILQPVVVRPVANHQFEIIAGERRWRAAKLANLTQIPVIIREVDKRAGMAMALIENIQRENLNPIEEAQALHQLTEDFAMSHQEVAEAVGKYRSTITNLLRLLTLDESVKQLIIEGTLSQGHGRVLITLTGEEQKKVANIIIKRQLSVRQTEDYVRQIQGASQNSSPPAEPPLYQEWQQQLAAHLSLPVKIKEKTAGKGTLEIGFKSEEELKKLLQALTS